MQYDPTLWSDAYNKKVIVSSPTNLFALLKLVDDLWKRDKQNKNAIAIATEGANLYDKFVGFAETLTDLGRSVSAAGEKYERAIKQLKTGSGNLIRRTERLREPGGESHQRPACAACPITTMGTRCRGHRTAARGFRLKKITVSVKFFLFFPVFIVHLHS